MRARFTEQMRGFHTPGAFAYDAGYVTGRRHWNRLGFELTIGTDDVAAALSDPLHVMTATGYVRCKELSAADLPVHDGTFNLLSPGSSRDRRLMRYRLPIDTPDGPMTLLGFKNVGNDHGFDSWSDTTTLYTRLVHGEADFDAPINEEYSRGMLRLNLAMFSRQLLTFRGTPAGIARFGVFFLDQLLRTYAHRPRLEVPR
jgi:hypothetical protein